MIQWPNFYREEVEQALRANKAVSGQPWLSVLECLLSEPYLYELGAELYKRVQEKVDEVLAKTGKGLDTAGCWEKSFREMANSLFEGYTMLTGDQLLEPIEASPEACSEKEDEVDFVMFHTASFSRLRRETDRTVERIVERFREANFQKK